MPQMTCEDGRRKEAPEAAAALDLGRLRERLAAGEGPAVWRSLDELAGTAAFQDLLEREFPRQAAEWKDPISRRAFLKLMGASLALAGLAACTREPEKILPYVRQPEEIVPGRPLLYATALTRGGYASGVLVESHEGRPVKVEGNALHPASLGGADAQTIAEVLALYDPDRSQVPTQVGGLRAWSDLDAELVLANEGAKARHGEGLRVLTQTVAGPTLAAEMAAFLAAFPEARWHQWDPLGRHATRAGARAAFGEDLEVQPRLAKAAVVLALDADFLGTMPGAVRHARDFAAGRRLRAGAAAPAQMSRLYAVEPMPTVTGARADHRLALKPSELEAFAEALARALGLLPKATDAGPHGAWIAAAAKDLLAAKGRGLVLAGDDASPFVHHVAHAANEALGNAGETVVTTAPVAAQPADQAASLAALCADMRAGKVSTLFILGGNPVYTAPPDLDFAGALEKVALRVHVGLHVDETAIRCHWHVPEAHELEAWGDARAFDGTASIQQPLVAPLYGGRSVLEVLAHLARGQARPGYDLVRAFWKEPPAGDDFEAFWRRAVHDGVVAGSAFAPKKVAVRPLAPRAPGAAAGGIALDGVEVVVRLDPCVLDGRYANNGWLQELPKPITKLTWDNAVCLAPALAERLHVKNEDVLAVARGGRTVRGAAWIVPGHADGAVTVHLGYGRARVGRIGAGAGFDAGQLRDSAALAGGAGAEITRAGAVYPLACTQQHHAMEGRDLVRAGTLEDYRKDPAFAPKRLETGDLKKLTLYPERPLESPQWAMAIDLSMCTGCNACVTACQSENNIPVVGKEEVRRGREMQWMRIDRYFEGPLDAPTVYHEPMLCQHCEDAPCEVVCPAGATTHSPEGLNEMAYNRCVGTRYCSNNCPYKVRRFNFLAYTAPIEESPVLHLLMNPDVTVRSRGVMEKCTFCVQRVSAARITAKKEDRAIRDGEVVTACEGACPAQAIVFGDMLDPKSRIAAARREPSGFGVLADRGTRPRVTYFPSIRNPNPEIGRPS